MGGDPELLASVARLPLLSASRRWFWPHHSLYLPPAQPRAQQAIQSLQLTAWDGQFRPVPDITAPCGPVPRGTLQSQSGQTTEEPAPSNFLPLTCLLFSLKLMSCLCTLVWRGMTWCGVARCGMLGGQHGPWTAMLRGLAKQPVQVRTWFCLGAGSLGPMERDPGSPSEQVASEVASWWSVGGQSVGRGASVAWGFGGLGGSGCCVGRRVRCQPV